MKVLLYILVLLLPLPAAGESAPQARAWLDKMAHAVKTLNYEGTFVYAHDQHLEAMHIIHLAGRDGEHERLVSLTGAAREILRDGDRLTCILPDSRSVLVEKSRPRKFIPEGLLNLSSGLGRHYTFGLLGRDRMAGRDAQIVLIKARDRYRYGYRLWLDRGTGMLLKSDLVDRQGNAVEQMMFTSLKLHERIPPERLKPAVSGAGFKWFRQEAPAREAGKGRPRWKVTRLPAGFMMSMHIEHGMPSSRTPVDHMMFTDGLSSVSVYVEEPDPHEEPFRGVSHMGAVNAFGTMVAGHQVTVVGEVPEATVVMIGQSVRRQGQGDQQP